MRNLFLYFISLVLISSACTDMIDIEPENSVTFENYFQNEQEIETTAYTMQDYLKRYVLMNSICPAAYGELSDKYYGSYEKARELSTAFFSPGSSISYWDGHYSAITWAHMVIDNMPSVKNISEERKNFYLGQAYFTRAYVYFKLLQTWGDVPLIVNMYDNAPRAQTPWEEVLDFAIKDGNRAARMLKPYKDQVDSNGQKLKSKQIPGKGSAYALLAHMHAWKAEFGGITNHLDSAIMAANYVIDGNLEEGYEPEFALAADPEAVITDVFMGNHDECIWELDAKFEELGQLNNAYYHVEKNYQGWPVDPTRAKSRYRDNSLGLKNSTVREIYKDGDKRRDAYFYQFEELENDADLRGWAVMYKRREAIVNDSDPNRIKFVQYKGNKQIWRLAGIHLLRAECYAKKGEDGKAIEDLNAVRNRAGAPVYKDSEGSVYYMVFKEREKELLAESHRWFDCLRTGYWRTELSPQIGALTEQEIEDGAFFLPVSKDAFVNQPQLRQNKYWLGKY